MYVPRLQVRLPQPLRTSRPATSRSAPVAPAAPPAAPAPRVKTRFGKASAFFLTLGTLALMVTAATPWLRGPEMTATGELATLLGQHGPEAVAADRLTWVVGAPLSLTLLPLLALLSGWATRRNTVWAKLFSYAAVLGTSALAFAAVHSFHSQQALLGTVRTALQASQTEGLTGEVTLHLGPALPVAVAALLLAAVAFWLGVFALHRRWWPRVGAMVCLGLPLTAGILWIYRAEAVLAPLSHLFPPG
jgi:hypothetical protein